MSHNPPNGRTIGRATYKKPKRMADAELAELFNRKKNAQSAFQTPGAKTKEVAVEKGELPTSTEPAMLFR